MARQNLAFFAELAGKTRLKKKDYDDVMRTVGLPEKALRMRLKNFSKGMRQKLGIASRDIFLKNVFEFIIYRCTWLYRL